MRTGAIVRLSRNSSIYIGGGGAVATALSFAVLGGVLRLALAAACFAAVTLVCVISYFVSQSMTSNRLEALKARAVKPGEVVPDGNYTKPRTWGVYKVESFKNGVRGYSYHLGNHPVRETELVREHGAADIVGLFTSRTDAEELKYLLNTGRVSSS